MNSLQNNKFINEEILYDDKHYKSSSENIPTDLININNKYNNLLNYKYRMSILQNKKLRPKKRRKTQTAARIPTFISRACFIIDDLKI